MVSKILPTDPAALTLKQMLRWKHALQGGPTWDDKDPIHIGKILDIKPAPYLSQPGKIPFYHRILTSKDKLACPCNIKQWTATTICHAVK